jgi:hypothetical protein
MMLRKVQSADGLKLRSTPERKQGNILADLPLGHEVAVLDEAPEPWWEVSTGLGGITRRGFVHSHYLREPLSPLKEALLRQAVKEWIRFERGKKKETQEPFSRYIGEYWKALGVLNRDGHNDVPWSAAFISFIIRQAGYGTSFKYAEGHRVYINDSIAKRQSNKASAFWGFRLDEHKPQLGDLICLWRNNRVTFDNRPDRYWILLR